jgi:hypothetical protein
MVYVTPSNSIGMKRYERFCQVDPARKYRSTLSVLQVSPISECRNTINIEYLCAFEDYPNKKCKYKCAKNT